MKHLLILSAFLFSTVAFANPQQDRMRACNTDAKGKHLAGQARKDFMKSCLSGGTEVAQVASSDVKPSDSKERMKWCNQQAHGKSGDERKSFMSTCLKNE